MRRYGIGNIEFMLFLVFSCIVTEFQPKPSHGIPFRASFCASSKSPLLWRSPLGVLIPPKNEYLAYLVIHSHIMLIHSDIQSYPIQSVLSYLRSQFPHQANAILIFCLSISDDCPLDLPFGLSREALVIVHMASQPQLLVVSYDIQSHMS